MLKRLAYKLADAANFAIDGFPNEGVAFGGYWIRRRRGPRVAPAPYRASVALDRCLGLPVGSVLDVGSGGGAHAAAFANAGRRVTCVDYGTSVYASNAVLKPEGVQVVVGDFNTVTLPDKFSLVWASHVLEHQQNVGVFLDRLISFAEPDGYVCITVPVAHRAIWGGHLTLWTPGLLAYNIVLCGVDLSSSELIHGDREFSMLFQPRMVALPTLTYDSGDVVKMAAYLPSWCRENSDGWH